MTATPPVPSPALPRRSIWRWILGGIAACFAVVVIGVLNVITLTRDAAALRNEMLGSLNERPSARIQVSIGPGILTSVRLVLRYIDRIPKEVRTALTAVRSASVGVYQLRGDVGWSERVKMFSSADTAMVRRGWVRIVGANDGRDTVLVYTPKREGWSSEQRVCVAVCDGNKVVVVSGTVDRDALVELAQQHRDFVRL